MQTIIVQATYQKGVLKPKTKLNLPENSTVQVEVRAVEAKDAAQPSSFASLAGIWAHLSDAEVEQLEKNLARARQQSHRKIKKLAAKQ